MDQVRYVLGVMLVVGVPPAVLYWFIIHPLAAFWRKMGTTFSYIVVGAVCGGAGYELFVFRDAVLGTDLGTNWILFLPGVLLYGASAWISLETRKQLSVRTFAGLPEIGGDGSGGTLLTEGVYGVIRHPRYLSVVIGTAGFALVVNFLGAYLMVAASVPALYCVVLLEERELSQRFGAEYQEYRARVPAIFPRLWRKGAGPLLLLLLGAGQVGGQQGAVHGGRSFHGSALGCEWEYSIYLPSGHEEGDRSYLKVYLLHSCGGGHTNWIRLGDAAFTTDSLTREGLIPPVILAMPEGSNSW